MRESAKPPVRGKTSPYGFFVKMCYEEHKKKYPNENVQVTEISKKCSEKWKVVFGRMLVFHIHFLYRRKNLAFGNHTFSQHLSRSTVGYACYHVPTFLAF